MQVYVHDQESSLERPAQELKGFEKIRLDAGAGAEVVLQLDKAAFSYYHPDRGEWLLESGDFSILVGSSSRDIRLRGEVAL